jgi:hypothetical protein
VLKQVLDGGVRLADQQKRRIAEFGRIVRRDRCGHADGDAGGAIGEQIGERAGQNRRLAVFLVIGGAEIDRILADALDQQFGDRGHLDSV